MASILEQHIHTKVYVWNENIMSMSYAKIIDQQQCFNYANLSYWNELILWFNYIN